MITDRDMRAQVAGALTDHAASFDVAGIVTELIERFGRSDIDDIPGPLFWQVVAAHDVEGGELP